MKQVVERARGVVQAFLGKAGAALDDGHGDESSAHAKRLYAFARMVEDLLRSLFKRRPW